MKSRAIALMFALVGAIGLAVAPALPAAVAAAPPAPTVRLDQGLHVSVGTVIGDDADAYGCGEAACGYLGIRVPVYAKWHQTNVTSEEGAAWSCNQLDGCIECCSAQWYWSGVRTTYAGDGAYPYYFRSGGRGFVDLTANPDGDKGTYATRNYTLHVSQEGAAKYSAGWVTGTGKVWSGGSVLKSTRAGQTATFTAKANQFALVTDKGPGRGTADIYFDGAKFASINDASATSVNRVVAAEKYKVKRGVHTLKVVVTSGRIDIDAFITS